MVPRPGGQQGTLDGPQWKIKIINMCQSLAMGQTPCFHHRPPSVPSVWVPPSPVPCAPSLHQVKSLYFRPQSATDRSPSASAPRIPPSRSLGITPRITPCFSQPSPISSGKPPLSLSFPHSHPHKNKPGCVTYCLRPWSGTASFPSPLHPRRLFL